MRIRCHLLGCRPMDEAPACRRCEAWMFGDHWREGGAAVRVAGAAYRRLRRLLAWPRCGQCRRRLWPLVGGTDQDGLRFCSQKCADDWIPF